MTLGMLITFRKSSKDKLENYDALKKSKLPFVIIKTDMGKAIKSREKYQHAEAYFFKSFNEAEDVLNNKKNKGLKCKIRGRGNSTWKTFDTNKRSYLLKLNEAQSLYGMNKEHKWILQANVTDKTSLRNVYAYHLAGTVFNRTPWSPRTQFIHLIINNKYMGLYALMEKAELSEKRIYPGSKEKRKKTFLAEVNSRQNRAWNFKSDKGVKFSIRENDFISSDEEKTIYYQQSEAKIREFEKVLYSDQFADAQKGWRAYADEESFVDWYLINEYTKNHDARFQDSCFIKYDADKEKFFMGPVWDFDISCGNINDSDCNRTDGLWVQSAYWFKRLWQDDNFRKEVSLRWIEKRNEISDSIIWLKEQAKNLEFDANIDDTIWQRFGYRQWPNAPGYKNRKTYQAEVLYLLEWCTERSKWLNNLWMKD